MASASAFACQEVPKPVFLMDLFGSPCASTGHLFVSTVGARPRSSSDGVKVSTGKDAATNDSIGKDAVVKDSTGKDAAAKDSTGEDATVKDSTGKDAAAKDSTGKDAAAERPRGHYLSIPKLFTADALDMLPEAARRDILLALAEDSVPASITGFSPRGWWVSKEDDDTVQLKVAMPGLGKEHVKMRAEKNTLVIKGDADKDSEGGDDKGPAGYMYRIGLNSQAFKLDQIKAEMKNGVLYLTVPKIKDEERKDVFEIKVE